MKKLNTFKLSLVATFMMCLMVAAFVCGGIKVDAAVATTISVDENGDLVLNNDNPYLGSELVVRVFSRTKVEGSDNYLAAGKYYFKNGKATMFAESIKTVPSVNYKTTTYTDITYSRGVYTKGAAGVDYSSKMDWYSGFFNNKVWCNGNLHNGYYLDVAAGKLYKCTNGVGNAGVCNGVIEKVKYVDSQSGTYKGMPIGGFYVVNGVMSTGLANLRYYHAGRLTTSLTGWKKMNGNIYYFKSGTAVTGWNTLPSYGKGVKKYRYLFNKEGVLYTNLVNYYGYNKFIKKDIKIITNKTTHNTTFYVKDEKGNYSIPALTVICATARKKNDTPKGTYRLEKTWTKRWFIYTKTHGGPYRYYQWAVHIKGTPTLYHSSTYRRTSAASLRSDLYNLLGTSCTTHCIRLQAKYAKMIYDIATKTNKKRRVPVQIITSKNEGPFGHVSLKKIKSGTKWDPTDPNKK